MASALIQELRTQSGNQPTMRRLGEDALQTYLEGTPLMINAVNGFVKAWDGVTIAAGILGISKTFGNNLTTANTAQQQSFGSVRNQASAKRFSRSFFNDGKTPIMLAVDDTVFYGQVGPAQTPVASDVGKQYGMTIDTDGHWFVDRTKVGAAAVVVIVKLDDNDTTRGVHFQFLRTVQQMPA